MFWFSGEDDAKLKASVNEVAMQFGTFPNLSFDTTLSRTIAVISNIEKPWLVVLDDMDELNISKSVVKLVSGPWQHNISGPGHLIITTRRKPRALIIDIRGFVEASCLELQCFCPEEAKTFIFRRTEIVPDEENGPIADNLVRKLGGLPLALEQACAYIRSLACPLSDYLQLYSKQSIRLLDEQKASRVSGNESPERLAVCTTWLLNFEHIKENKNGMVAIRFMNASAFMNPNEIQQELINVGEPPVEDGAYRHYVSTSLGSRQVIKTLTDFSLFKETRASCLSVHRLVQEVIRENLEPEQKAESIVDAVRLLRFAFSKCPSPDDLLTSVATERHERSSIRSTDPSFFYKWHKLCLHSYELLGKLKALLYSTCVVSKKTVFLPETARIVYECALYLNVNGNSWKALTVAEFANHIYYFGDNVVSEEKLKALFPHMIPLPESVQRYVQYSCREPLPVSEPENLEDIGDISQKRKRLEEMRLEGNNLFKKNCFKESIEVYSSAIDMSKGTNLFDARFLSNRASAYLNLKQYDNALKDAEGYIVQCPECWRGYARKALALDGMNKKRYSKCAAALAFYRDRSVFCEFPPFKKAFLGLEKCISFCNNLSLLLALLPIVSNDDNIIVLEPGEYRLSADDFDRHKITMTAERNRNIERLRVGNCILVGAENSMVKSGVTLSFLRNFGLLSQSCMAVNISFVFDMGNWHADRNSIVDISNCSFTSNLEGFHSPFLSGGTLNVENCCFKNCKGTGLNVAGNARIEDSVISGNEYVGLQVSPGGRLWLENSKLFGNSKLGLHIAKAAGKCSVLNCEIYDNKYQGVGVTESTDIKLIGNRIFHNDRHGIFIDSSSFAIIERNEIFENCWLGIATQNNASCRISRNRIYHNKCGGVHVVPVAPQPVGQEQVVEFNKIFGNGGPGIDESGSISDIPNTSLPHIFNRVVKRPKDLEKAKCIKNELYDNEEEGVPPTSKDVNNICFFCNKEGSLKKCTRCFTAAYCNSECQTQHWKKHKSSCPLLLERASVLVKVLPTPFHSDTDGSISTAFMMSLAPDFRKPLGPKHAKAPKRGKKIVIKIDAGDVPRLSNTRGSLLNVYDRSLTIHGDIEHKRFYNLVRLCGINSELSGWKTMFMWALIQENDMLRVFINEFPPYHLW